MTGKVRVPQNVADSIEKFRNADISNYGIIIETHNVAKISGLEEEPKILLGWIHGDGGGNADKLLAALVKGYEVEPEQLRVGDWVTRIQTAYDGIGSFTEGYTFQIQSFTETASEKHAVENNDWAHKISSLRHSTPEEVATEKERQKWAAIEEGDVIQGLKSGKIAVFLGVDSRKRVVEVELRYEEYETWHMDSCELYAKKVKPRD